MCKFHFRLIVNTSAWPVGFKIHNQWLNGDIDEKSAGDLKRAMDVKYHGPWYILVKLEL